MARKLDVPHALAEALEQSAFVVAADDPDAAEDLHHQALAIRVGLGLRTFYVDSLDALAGLAAGAESFAEAARLLAASDAARRLMGYPRPPVDASAHEETVATVRAALGDDGFAEASTQGGALSLDDAVAYATRARGRRSRPSSGWASLTPTEVDVVRLVSEGLTNPEIGARLFMSRATVKTHLSHVYAKLGVANRTELATFAITQLADQRARESTPPTCAAEPAGANRVSHWMLITTSRGLSVPRPSAWSARCRASCSPGHWCGPRPKWRRSGRRGPPRRSAAPAGERHGRGGRSGPAFVDQRQCGGVSLHQHAHDCGGVLRPPAARRHEAVRRQVRFLRLREMRLVGGGDQGDVGLELGRKPECCQERPRRCALVGDEAEPIDHAHDHRPTATMRVALAEPRHGRAKPADSARRGGATGTE